MSPWQMEVCTGKAVFQIVSPKHGTGSLTFSQSNKILRNWPKMSLRMSKSCLAMPPIVDKVAVTPPHPEAAVLDFLIWVIQFSSDNEIYRGV